MLLVQQIINVSVRTLSSIHARIASIHSHAVFSFTSSFPSALPPPAIGSPIVPTHRHAPRASLRCGPGDRHQEGDEARPRRSVSDDAKPAQSHDTAEEEGIVFGGEFFWAEEARSEEGIMI
jgi:hypothetical protein